MHYFKTIYFHSNKNNNNNPITNHQHDKKSQNASFQPCLSLHSASCLYFTHYLYIICDHNNSFSIIFRLSFSALCSQAEYMVSMITLIPLILVISCSSHFRVEHYLAFSTYYLLAIQLSRKFLPNPFSRRNGVCLSKTPTKLS